MKDWQKAKQQEVTFNSKMGNIYETLKNQSNHARQLTVNQPSHLILFRRR
jgi:hypothetical protein